MGWRLRNIYHNFETVLNQCGISYKHKTTILSFSSYEILSRVPSSFKCFVIPTVMDFSLCSHKAKLPEPCLLYLQFVPLTEYSPPQSLQDSHLNIILIHAVNGHFIASYKAFGNILIHRFLSFTFQSLFAFPKQMSICARK